MLRIKNNTQGYFSITLQDMSGIKPDRTFFMEVAGKEVSIPDDYAESIYSDPYAISSYKKGYFTIVKGEDALVKKLAEEDEISQEDVQLVKNSIVSNEDLEKALLEGNKEKLEKYINSNNVERLTQIAIERKNVISQNTIDMIETATGIAIQSE